jgi:hypothetical protein
LLYGTAQTNGAAMISLFFDY